jgi:hypothetical protein
VDTPTKVFTGYERLERERLSVALLEAVEALFDPDHLRPVWQVAHAQPAWRPFGTRRGRIGRH